MSAESKPRVRVLIVDDSPTYRALLTGLIDSDPRLLVIGVVDDGAQALEAADRMRPDVIVMDIHLPGVDGFAATRRIMETCPTRIVMVTATSIPHEVSTSFEALESGALMVLGKPPGPGHESFDAARKELLNTVALMAEVPVVRRWPAALMSGVATSKADHGAGPITTPVMHPYDIAIVAVGTSTGGPLALQAFFSALRPGFAAPVVIVQHISLGFSDGLVQWLSRASGYPVRVAVHNERLEAGRAYLAPDGVHMQVKAEGRVVLSHGPPINGFRPSVAALFTSVAREYGPRAAGLLLTGMGMDGARELSAMRQAGALTMVQDRDSALIYGMPGEAIRLGAAMHVFAPQDMAAALNRLVPK